ncbi:FAD-dependent monooxygenase [Acinetobacter ihumii]|uniref:FAD-dependent monooxygenase n=1 Tax=Acinetobacter ihumii TaxID=2483802 RepID=UPI0010311044|nr:FAD-dependent monooxygenase [Acinetobacter ihumii]
MSALKIAIIGGGVGGLAAAIALRKYGHEVTVFEQASGFSRVGADINLTPNVVRAIDGLGAGEAIRKLGAMPTYRISRDWDTSLETSRLGMSQDAEQRYGAPQVTIHRADIINALAALFPIENIEFSKKLKTLKQHENGVQLHFEDGSTQEFDIVVGADGIHSRVRTALFGEESPRFTGIVSFRSVVPTEKVKHVPEIEAFTKWWGPVPEQQIVTFPLNQGKDTFIFATTGQESWTEESWTSAGDVNELREFYKDFHPDAKALLDACESTLKSALYERDPLPAWSIGTVTLLGDACHPMLPFMAQGAGMAIEDAVVLGRSLQNAKNQQQAQQALKIYEKTRQQRTAQIQLGSRGNQWMKQQGNADWVYQYDAWNTPLEME